MPERSPTVAPAAPRAAFALTLLALAAPPVAAQCTLQAQAGAGLPGVPGTVTDVISWDPDGAGPGGAVLVVAGNFALAGAAAARNVATFDPSTAQWAALGTGTSDTVVALAVLGDGRLVAGGVFATAGGIPANGIAAWDGTSWQSLGGTNGVVIALATLANGDTVAGGNFTSIGGVPAQGIARWNGTTWAPIGAPAGLHADGGVACIAELPGGELVAGGNFTVSFGAVANRVARWDGVAWSPMGTGMNRYVGALHVRPNGELLAGGEFTNANGVAANRIARWTGTTWAPLGTGVAWTGIPATSYIEEIVSLPGGDVAVGGFFSIAGGVPAAGIARWNGGAWSAYAQGPPAVVAMMVLPGGELVASGHAGTGVAQWDGAAWAPLGRGIGPSVLAAAALPGGDAVVGGTFLGADGQSAARIARWSDGTWSPFGGGMNGQVQALATAEDGSVLAGGAFTIAGGVPANRVARWDGTSWSPLGIGFTSPGASEVFALLPLPGGDVIAGGFLQLSGGTIVNHIARWNGTSWSPLGSGVNNLVFALARLPNGDIVAGGDFTTAGGAPATHVARWNGTAWSPMGGGMNWTVESLAVRPNGELVAVGRFTTAGAVAAARAARWDGTSWWPLGSGLDGIAREVVVLPDGDLIVAGNFAQAGGVTVNRVARYGASGWSAVGAGVAGTLLSNGVETAALLTDGTVLIGGAFHGLNGLPVANLAALRSPCAATTASYGSGCTGAGGANVLAATSLPWLGSTFRARATGMPANGIAASVYGFAPASTPLAALLPQGLPGCVLQCSPDILDARLPAGGAVDTSISLPVTTSLAGAVFFHFVAALELDAQGIAAISSSNGIAATIGDL